MRRTVAGLIALVFLASAAWTFMNEATVESWLRGQLVTEQEDSIPLVPLQDNEQWLVVVVDFESAPAGNGWGVDEAENLLNQAIVPYVEQLSGNTSSLQVTVHPTVVRANSAMEDYGRDAAGKDTDADGRFLPAQLAEEAVAAVRSEVNWSMFDLNKDQHVDRFLVLHSTKGQEENPGIVNRIWSHFTQFERPLDLPDGLVIEHYTMASLQTGSSGVGTMIHEMLHQMGAVDLYPVHDEVSSQPWKGPGDWDIMASGNWNGGGRWPAMPTGANTELVRAERIETLELVWPATASAPCIGPSIQLDGVTQGGTILKIPLTDEESVFIEHRADSGYDSRLPGHGLLVTYQDLSVGDFERNEVNTNPNQPWLKVIEADMRDDLVRGSNQGEQSDLFLNGTTFGAQGVEIRTHDGFLVPWVASVSGDENLTVSFTATECTPSFDVDLPDHGATLLSDQSLNVTLSGKVDNCSSSLLSSDGRGVLLVSDASGHRLEFSREGVANSFVTVEGTISCDGRTVDLLYDIHIMQRIPEPTSFDAQVHPSTPTRLEIPISSVGSGEQRLSVMTDGPLSRVASGNEFIVLADDSAYILDIEPNGLLTENMLVYGSLKLMTEEGMVWTVDVALEATSTDETWLTPWTEPGRIVGLMLTIVGLSALTSVFTRTTSAAQKAGEHSTSPAAQMEAKPVETDAWGRPIDASSLTETPDVDEGM